MTGRLAAAVTAIAATVILVAWGLGSGRAASGPANAHPATAGPSLARPVAASAAAGAPPAGWRLVFDSRFRGTRLDTSVWATCYPWRDVPSGCTNFGNTEYEWFLPAQDRVSHGLLHLTAQHAPTPGLSSDGRPQTYLCRSGMITSYPSLRFRYGYIRVVAKIPTQPGLWSGLWLAAADERWPPEIDILEHWGTASGVSGLYLHPVTGHLLREHVRVTHLGSAWHTFGLNWSPGSLTWSIDGRVVLTTHADVPRQAMYFVADLAEYQRSAPCSGQLELRSVEVWQPA